MSRIYLSWAALPLFMLVFSSQTCSSSQSFLPDPAFRETTKTASETVRERNHTWKISADPEGTVLNEGITIEVVNGKSVNPSLHSSGSVDFSSLGSIVKQVTSPGMTEEQKALSLWRFVMENLYNGKWGTCFDGLEHLNVYGYGYCGSFAWVLDSLWWEAGLKARHVNIGNHAATEVYYDNDWHYIDSHRRCYFLEKDNRTIASLDVLNEDPSLWDMRRGKKAAERGRIKYYYMSMHPGGGGRSPEYSKDFVMAGGDVLDLSWEKRGKWSLERGWGGGGKPAPEPEIYANGTFTFRRDLSDSAQNRVSLVRAVNIHWGDTSSGCLHPLKAEEAAEAVYEVRVPYFITSAEVTGEFLRKRSEDTVALDISTDGGGSWTQIWNAVEKGKVTAHTSTDRTQQVTPWSLQKYSYLIRIRMRAGDEPGDVGACFLESTADLVYNPKGIPVLRPGENLLVFQDEGEEPRALRVTYRWKEDPPISLSTDNPLEGEEVTLKARISKAGKGDALNVPVVFYQGDPDDGGTEIGRYSVDSIPAGTTAVASVKWTARRDRPRRDDENSAGAAIFARIDPETKAGDNDRTNNASARLFKPLNPPDVAIPSPSFISLAEKTGASDVLTISAAVRNFSNSSHYGHYLTDHAEATDITVRFFDGMPGEGRQIGASQVISRLLPLEVENVAVDWDISGLKGRHLIYVEVLTPGNVRHAIGEKGSAIVSRPVDLDAYRSCSG
ncbi:CARDB domain-containing protein [Candidatus Moduliflexota bacterium]